MDRGDFTTSQLKLLAVRIGIIALLHESNTFSVQPTTLDSFRQNMLLDGQAIRPTMADSHHEVGGFFQGLDEAGAEAVGLLAARALPSGTINEDAFDTLLSTLIANVQANQPLDGILVAPHGATVSQAYPDADGHWLATLRQAVGSQIPIIGTLDAHANLSAQMVNQCDALVAYRTNPHLDQRDRGIEAAKLIVRTLRGEIDPVMSAAFPPLAISIERQCTDEAPLRSLYQTADQQLRRDDVLSNSVLLGFPYADVAEMGASAIVITDGDKPLAERLSNELAESMWRMRGQLKSEFISVNEAIAQCESSNDRFCLLDMGDNVGGGSAADGTELLEAIHQRQTGPAFGCLYDPESVRACQQAGVGNRLSLHAGGRTDHLHGVPIECTVTVISLHDGKFRESKPRHGGITDFDQGPTAICRTDAGLTLMLTSRRMVPFSLQQLYSCELDPRNFRVLVAKGVNAPLAAYSEVCDQCIRVNTGGSTCADLSRIDYQHRRRPMFPFEADADYVPNK